MKSIRMKLPYDMQKRWQTYGTIYTQKYNKPPQFSVFSEWINGQADMISDPNFRIESNKRNSQKDKEKDKSHKALKTEGSAPKPKSEDKKAEDKDDKSGKQKDAKSGEVSSKPKGSCLYHPEGYHKLKDCRTLLSLPEFVQKQTLAKWGDK